MFLEYLLAKRIISPEEYEYFQKEVQMKSIEGKDRRLIKAEQSKSASTSLRQSKVLKERKVFTDREAILSKFDKEIRFEAAEMSQNYEMLYSLEKSIRNLVLEVMANKYGFEWWEKKVKFEIKEKVIYNRQNELNTGHTQLSENEIDYTTFGDLRQIIESNWGDFSGLLKNKFVFNRIMYTLNQLRGPLTH